MCGFRNKVDFIKLTFQSHVWEFLEPFFCHDQTLAGVPPPPPPTVMGGAPCHRRATGFFGLWMLHGAAADYQSSSSQRGVSVELFWRCLQLQWPTLRTWSMFNVPPLSEVAGGMACFSCRHLRSGTFLWAEVENNAWEERRADSAGYNTGSPSQSHVFTSLICCAAAARSSLSVCESILKWMHTFA